METEDIRIGSYIRHWKDKTIHKILSIDDDAIVIIEDVIPIIYEESSMHIEVIKVCYKIYELTEEDKKQYIKVTLLK